MHQSNHWEFLLSNQIHKKDFIDQLISGNAPAELLFLNTRKGILFSDLSIEKFIEKEFQYDIVASANSGRQLRTFSSGERKKEFLKFCIDQQPDFIIFDNPLDHLDHDSRLRLTQQIKDLSKDIIVIQLVNRKTDLFDFIPNKAQITKQDFQFEPINFDSDIHQSISQSKLPDPPERLPYFENPLIQLDQVSVQYEDRKIISNIEWSINKGDFWQLIGPNGSGKSTILTLINGDNAKGYGQNLYLFGRKKGSGESVWDIKKNIGYYATAMTDLFQKSHTLEQMILSGFFDSIGLYNQPTTHQKILTAQWLEVLQMTALKKKIFNQLSIGQQRVALIVRAVLKHPALLILDEPLEGLDDENADLVIQLLNFLAEESAMAIIFVSHRIEKGLNPKSVFELIPTENGSIGKIRTSN